MRFSHSRSRGVRRGLALAAAAGTFLLGGPAAPATAQAVGPPPYNPGFDTGSSLQKFNYPQKQACMQGNSGGGFIEEKPWSQLVLGFEQFHQDDIDGRGQLVAVIDTGVNRHPRLSGAVVGGDTSITADGRGDQDCDGHGTLVAGIIAARPDPSGRTGYIGVAPAAQIMSLRQQSTLFTDEGSGQTIGNTETMAQAINEAVERGADVINISQSSCQPIAQAANPADRGNQELQTAVKRAFDNNVVVVVAAGNASENGQGGCQKNPTGSPTTAVLPAWFDDYVLTVGSVNQEGAPSEFTVPGPWVDVAAPGENLVALDPGVGGSGLASQITHGQDGQMQPIQGTSFAAPYVAGLAVLIKQKFPNLTAAQIMDRIKKTALHPGGTNGKNDIVGYGMIDPAAAMADVIPAEYNKNPPPPRQKRLAADALQQRDFPAMFVALGGAGVGIAAIIFAAFLTNAVRAVRARQRENANR